MNKINKFKVIKVKLVKLNTKYKPKTKKLFSLRILKRNQEIKLKNYKVN